MYMCVYIYIYTYDSHAMTFHSPLSPSQQRSLQETHKVSGLTTKKPAGQLTS